MSVCLASFYHFCPASGRAVAFTEKRLTHLVNIRGRQGS
jgi:hypothetical protein